MKASGLKHWNWKGGGGEDCQLCGEKIKTRSSTVKYHQKCYWRLRREAGIGKEIVHHGYIFVKQPNHPKCNNQGYVRKHRLVMEEHIGRYLEQDEIVHHINHDRLDNKIENLMILTPSEHSKYHGSLNVISEEGKRRISELHKGQKYWLGKTHKAETVHKISLAATGRKMKESSKEKLRLANLGKKLSEETLAKMRGKRGPNIRTKNK